LESSIIKVKNSFKNFSAYFACHTKFDNPANRAEREVDFSPPTTTKFTLALSKRRSEGEEKIISHFCIFIG
jgi:hypothetical protein